MGKAPLAAERWVAGILEAMEGLTSLPRRGRRAAEDQHLRIGLRQLLHRSYRVLFILDEVQRVVNVLYIRHAARQAASCGDVTDQTT